MTPPSENAERCARAWVDVDPAAIVANAKQLADISGARLMPMVKANGYGLGAIAAARALEAVDPWGYGVATVEEGAELRSAGIGRPVVVFTPLIAPWIEGMVRHDLRPVIGDPLLLDRWRALAGGRPFHIGVDTGMGRAGVAFDDPLTIAALAARLQDTAGYEGVCSHFHSADEGGTSLDAQQERFESVIRALGRRPDCVHMANSAAALRGPRYAGNLARPGIYLYGSAAGGGAPRPAAALRALVVDVREVSAGSSVSYGATWSAAAPTRIATIGVGYADGVPRSLGNRGAVELRGARVPIRGRVTMDMTMVEAPRDVRPGDVATVFGGLVTLDEQAASAGTIPYELLTGLGRRVERRYGPLA